MADPLQFAQQLAHQTSAATNQYRAQGADIGGPIAQGLQTGIGIGMNFEEFELKQAMAEAQVQENQIRMANLAQETILRQGIAQTRMMESQEKMMAMDLEARDKAEGRSIQRERLKLEAQQAAPLPLANGKWRVVTPGAGGQMSSMDVDADHPAMMPWKNQWQSRGDGTVKYEPAYKDLLERESSLAKQIQNNKTFAENDPERLSPEQIAEVESELSDVKGRLREMAKSPGARGKVTASAAGASVAPPQQSQNAQWVLAGLRRDATAKLEMDDQQLEAGLDRVARLMRAAGQDLDPVTGEPVSKETLMVNILSQAKRDDDDGRALADMLRKAARK